MERIKVGVSQLCYPVTMGNYMIEALRDRDDCEVYVIGPNYGTWIPWSHGMNLQEKYKVNSWSVNFPITRHASMPYTMATPFFPEKVDFDLFIMIDAGFRFSTRPEATVVAHIKTDPHAISKQEYDIGSSVSDYVFSMQTPYKEDGEFYLPYAYSPKWHYPEKAEKEYDACLIGLMYDSRILWIEHLRSKGLNVYYNIGEVYEEYRRRYAKSKVALNWASKLDLPARVWEGFAMNLPVITNRLPDLNTFFSEDDHYLGFDTLKEAVEKTIWAVEHYDEALEMAHAAYRKVKPHTWDARMQQVLETCRMI